MADLALQEIATAAGDLLRVLAGPDARLRDDQLTAIAALVEGAKPVLVVQRTGWGKSAVYWIATALRRRSGAGPTLVVSPLLALMRDQVGAAERMGLRAATINSTNVEDWDAVTARLDAGELDVLLISPERLNNPSFRAAVLPDLARRIGTLVVDEAHAISEWGHDFRPDYRRLGELIAGLDRSVAVLATTATANARVTADIAAQLGTDTLTLRGELGRDSLDLAVVHLATGAERLAWVAAEVAESRGSGIVYCLTVAEVGRVAEFLASEGLAVAAYSGEADPEDRARIEEDLRDNRLKAVVATTALGMGYDKPDLGFVVHLGSPNSPIGYYQQVGRAGRAIERAAATLLPAGQDRDIWTWSESTAFPPAPMVEAVLETVAARGPISVPALEQVVNLRRSRIEAMLKVLDVEGALWRSSDGWMSTGRPWAYDHSRIDRVRAARRAEADAMVAYASSGGCRMQFLRDSLDDTGSGPCGHCDNCAPRPPRVLDPALVERALAHLRSGEVVLEPRKMWPSGLRGRKGRIAPGAQPDTGRALAFGNDPGWAPALQEVFAHPDRPVDPAVLAGCVAVLRRWRWAARPTWVTWVPSAGRPGLAEAVASHLAGLGRLNLAGVLRRVAERPPQSSMANSGRQAANVLDAFALDDVTGFGPGPVLVVDDTWNSGWTMTVVAEALRAAGSGPVLPFVLWRRP
ncbi:RecQ family ATP-dependent DNA helicase [Acidiferrimicrobium sp. IK]|uniref:RecQ family ATP-dependent DNA helicase n=1 Tax=Acidiferrimicrobium sp. IK TaxID=2871700 RepID=UPI0021CB727B|nr:RecQ family ATP-dependent DNA helicase [Acidiferrimicrobium sp. IK]MCU4183316.1 RecQ family ATP-dependent DNA helicase [Acidiferrimicrobium sp. IK]